MNTFPQSTLNHGGTLVATSRMLSKNFRELTSADVRMTANAAGGA